MAYGDADDAFWAKHRLYTTNLPEWPFLRSIDIVKVGLVYNIHRQAVERSNHYPEIDGEYYRVTAVKDSGLELVRDARLGPKALYVTDLDYRNVPKKRIAFRR